MPVASGAATTVASSKDIVVEQGSDIDIPWALQNADGTPYMLTGASAQLQVREYVDATTVLYEMSTSNGKILLDAGTGVLTLRFSRGDFNGSWWSGVYDLKLTSNANKRIPLLKGKFYVEPEVTR